MQRVGRKQFPKCLDLSLFLHLNTSGQLWGKINMFVTRCFLKDPQIMGITDPYYPNSPSVCSLLLYSFFEQHLLKLLYNGSQLGYTVCNT